jgi:hypothetical protein
MPLTRPIPKKSMRLVKDIRRLVPRPKKLPRVVQDPDGSSRLEWGGKIMLFYSGVRISKKGPEKLTNNRLDRYFAFDNLDTSYPYHRFLSWWHEQTDAKAAVDAVWGKKRSRSSR